MSQATINPYQTAVQKAERFFARSNFLLAKKEFEKALKIASNEALQKKRGACLQQIDQQKGKEDIKRGRNREKRSRHSEALQCYQQALARGLSDAWLLDKISTLKEKLLQTEALNSVEKAQASGDLTAILAAYENIPPADLTPVMIAWQTITLVRVGRYQQAIDLFSQQPLINDKEHYYFGYALLKTGQYIQALAMWHKIEDTKQGCLDPDYQALLPFAYRQLSTDSDLNSYTTIYHCVHRLMAHQPSVQFMPDGSSFLYKYIDVLWCAGRYTEILAVVSALSDKMSLAKLGLYARVYYKLAEQYPHYLKMAISFWLTAIYNDALLQSLSCPAAVNDVPAVRNLLLKDLESLIEHHHQHQQPKQDALPQFIQLYWQLEKRLIQRLLDLPLDHGQLSIFPCTPVLAEKFGLSAGILSTLNAQRDSLIKQGEGFFEVSAYFSEAGRSLALMEQDQAEQALASLPDNDSNDISTYCRQRVLFSYGVYKTRQGELQTKRWFLQALPLLKQYAKYGKELAKLAVSDLPSKAYAGLVVTMEALNKHIGAPEFKVSTAYIMGLQAMHLHNEGARKSKTALKLAERALIIDPGSSMAKSALRDIKQASYLEQIGKAFKQRKLMKAANIVHQQQDPELTDFFFKIVEHWLQKTSTWDEEAKTSMFHELYNASCQVDKLHPLTLNLGIELSMA